MEKFIKNLGLHPKLDWSARMKGVPTNAVALDTIPASGTSPSKP